MTFTQELVLAAQGKHPLTIRIDHARIVDVFTEEIISGSVGIYQDTIAAIGPQVEEYPAREIIDAENHYVLPGFIDSHMHVESSMLTPYHFAALALKNGTTSCAADPHEIANVMGLEGVKALVQSAEGLPLHIYFYSPSTIPSAPGFEGSGYSVGPRQTNDLLNATGNHGLGEVMDFNGVIRGEENILNVIDEAKKHHVLVDGHVPLLMGAQLQGFRASGIDSDHCVNNPAKLIEEQRLGFTSEVQGNNMNHELIEAVNQCKHDNRICICTDDVSLSVLLHKGHLNYAVEKAISMGLPALKAIRMATINAADRMRLTDTGAIVPGRKADIQILADLNHPKPSLVLSRGKVVVRQGIYVGDTKTTVFPSACYETMKLNPLGGDDMIPYIDNPEHHRKVLVNAAAMGESIYRTKLTQIELPVRIEPDGRSILEYSPYCRMAVFNRHGGHNSFWGIIDGLSIHGAVAATYGHDAHNLSLFGSNDQDMMIAANETIAMRGGFVVVRDKRILARIPLPIAGLLSEQAPEQLEEQESAFRKACRKVGFEMEDPLTFFMIMPLAVSPAVRITDQGLVDVNHRSLLPLISEYR